MANRDKNGKFLKGHKGYKAQGKTAFTLLRDSLKTEEPALIKAIIDQAKAGNPAAVNFVFGKMYGKHPFNTFQLKGNDLEAVSKHILASVGIEDPQVLRDAAKLLESHVAIVELSELQKRIEALENK